MECSGRKRELTPPAPDASWEAWSPYAEVKRQTLYRSGLSNAARGGSGRSAGPRALKEEPAPRRVVVDDDDDVRSARPPSPVDRDGSEGTDAEDEEESEDDSDDSDTSSSSDDDDDRTGRMDAPARGGIPAIGTGNGVASRAAPALAAATHAENTAGHAPAINTVPDRRAADDGGPSLALLLENNRRLRAINGTLMQLVNCQNAQKRRFDSERARLVNLVNSQNLLWRRAVVAAHHLAAFQEDSCHFCSSCGSGSGSDDAGAAVSSGGDGLVLARALLQCVAAMDQS
ncbi:unnamed protein product [Phaeothamnion confervicola]